MSNSSSIRNQNSNEETTFFLIKNWLVFYDYKLLDLIGLLNVKKRTFVRRFAQGFVLLIE